MDVEREENGVDADKLSNAEKGVTGTDTVLIAIDGSKQSEDAFDCE